MQNAFLRISWLDVNGERKTAEKALAVDISEMGMAIQLPEAALVLSRVTLQSDEYELLGQGAVRHCRRVGNEYVVGIEFTDQLRWCAPQDPVTEPIALSAPSGEEQTAPASEPEKPYAPLDAGAAEELLDRVPIAVKAGGPVLVALGVGFYLLFAGHSSPASAVSAGGGLTASIVGEQGWVTEWASDADGSRRGRQITLYRPSAHLSDYLMEFTGQIESKALGWVFRAAGTRNYYGMKIEKDAAGSVRFARFAVVAGRKSSVTRKPLPIQARADTSYNVRLEVSGPRFSVYIQGEPVDVWTDNRLKGGAVGFMNEREEIGRTSAVKFSFPKTTAGR